MATFELTVLLSIYVFTVFMELGFEVDDWEGKSMDTLSFLLLLIAIILSPISIAWKLGELLQQRLKY